MTTDTQSSGVQELIERLHGEGVAKGQDEAAQLVDEARRQSMKITDDARREAEQILNDARAETERIRHAGEEALRQAARDALLRLQESIREELTVHVRKLVAHKLEDQSFLERMILEVARRSMPQDSGEHVEILLPDTAATVEELSRNPEDASPGSLTQFVLGLTGDAIREGLTFKPAGDHAPGIRVQIVDEDVQIDLTAESISELLMRHVLLPRLAAALQADDWA